MPSKKHRRAVKRVGKRSTNNRQPRKVFLIVCEGEETEPNYFNALARDLRVNAQVEVSGIGNDPKTLLHKAEEYKKRESYDEVWCIFDKDQIDAQSFNSVIARIDEKSGMDVGWSNRCFELWFVLHFNYHVSASAPESYAKILNSMIPGFDKRRGYYEVLRELTPTAIRNAEKLLSNSTGQTPAQCNPATTVFRLVQRLQAYSDELYKKKG